MCDDNDVLHCNTSTLYKRYKIHNISLADNSIILFTLENDAVCSCHMAS
jgi:hypothetical protein